MRLFLSYARTDRAEVEPLAEALMSAGFDVWWDAAIEGGHSFSAEIERQLEAADAVLVVWSADAVRSNWVLDEAMHGRDRGCLVPLLLDETPPPLGFRQIQAIPLDPADRAGDVAAISRAVARIGNLPVPEEGRHPRSTAGKRPRAKDDKPLWYPFAWVAMAMLIWLISWGMMGR